MISKLKKNKVIDIVYYRGEYDMLLHRLHSLENEVDYFIIFEKYESTNFVEKKNLFSRWSHKIHFYPFDSTNSLNEEILKKIDLNFEDILFFSKVSEFPKLEYKEEMMEHLNFEPIILRHTNLIYNTKYYTPEKHLGTIGIYYTEYLNNENIIDYLEELKSKIVTNNYYLMDNGINHSFDVEVSEKKICDFEEPYPFDKKFLKEQELEIKPDNKIIVVLNFHQNLLELTSEFPVMNINFTYDYNFPKSTVNNNIETVNIFLPPHQYYNIESTLDYEATYLINEVKKVLKKTDILNSQKIEFVPFYEELELDRSIVLIWGEIKNLPFQEVLKDIIKNPSI